MRSAAEQARDSVFASAVLGGAGFGVAFVDTDLRLIWVNPAFADLGGLRDGDYVGTRLADAVAWAHRSIEDQAREVLQGGAPLAEISLSPPLRGPGDAIQHWRATISAVHSDAGVLLGAAIVCTDVTEAVALREQFVQSQKMEAVGLLANVIAHDFNNLLSVIQGYGDLLLRSSSDEVKRTKRLREIVAAAEAAGQLSRQLLTLSRRNSGATGPVDLNLLVRAIGRMLERILPANVAQEFMLAEDLGLTLADPGELEQILMNLITNAIDAMPAGGLLTIATSNSAQSPNTASGDEHATADYVTVSVTDTGTGMDVATVAQMFEPTFTTKPAGRGTGLGLSTVRTLVARLQGDVSVTSAPGKGSTFQVRLPRVRPATTTSGGGPATPAKARAATILVVEDHEQFRGALVSMLEEAGYTVIATGAGGEAIRAAAEHPGPIDLLIADVELPDAEGPALAERIRTARPGMRVLVSSGFGEQALSPADAAHNGYAIIGKPYAMSDILGTIQAILYPAVPAASATSG